jgi:catechol 2,3-dioxygenase-like lactoylglutathione lyase family enzyme
MKLKTALLFCKDLERMVAFYEGGLGLRVLEKSPGWVELEAGGATLGLHAIPGQLAAEIEVTTPPAPRSEAPTKLIFEADDLTLARGRATAHGAVMFEVRGGRCDGLDPEGNVFQLVAASS